MLGEVRGPFGEHQGYIQLRPDLSGHTAFLFIGILGAAAYHLIFGMAAVLDRPQDYAWVHVASTHFYYYTAFLPLKSVGAAWNFFGWLTPWVNLNFVLAVILTPVYCYAALVLLVGVWIGFTRHILRMNPVFLYLVPALLSGMWAAGQWMFS